MSSSGSETPTSPRPNSPQEEKFEEDFQEIQLTYRDEFANEVLVFTSLDDFQCGIKMTRMSETDDSGGDIFQCLVSFPPGNHTYRYLVDGEWMCDEIKEVKYVMGNATMKLKLRLLVPGKEKLIWVPRKEKKNENVGVKKRKWPRLKEKPLCQLQMGKMANHKISNYPKH